MLKDIKKSRKGFSIGEVILSVFIIVTIATAVVGMYVTAINEFRDERDNIVASLLAQEGVELVRNVRDNNWAGATAGSVVSFDNLDDGDCTIDIIDSDRCPSASGGFNLRYDSGSGEYSYTSGSSSQFSRKIIITDVGGGSFPDQEKEVLSLVTWRGESVLGKNKSNCTTSSKCVFSEAVLSEWGGPQ